VNSFYVKSAWNSDGSHFASGSSDSKVYIWQAEGRGAQDAYVLAGHEKEVTTVAWCPTDPLEIASAADDCTLRIWKVDRVQQEEEPDPPRKWEGPHLTNPEIPSSPHPSPASQLLLTQERATAPPPPSSIRPSRDGGGVGRLKISRSLMDGTFLESQGKRRRQQTLMESLKGTRSGRLTPYVKDLDECAGKQAHGHPCACQENHPINRVGTELHARLY